MDTLTQPSPAGRTGDRYTALDVPSGPELDDVVRLAAQICGTSMALVTVIDQPRLFFAARIGVRESEIPLDVGFCPHVIQGGAPLTIADTAADPAHASNPATLAGVRFYAGVPLISPHGDVLGTLCVLDRAPHSLREDQQEALEALARQVMAQVMLRHVVRREREGDTRHALIVDSAIDHAIIGIDRDGTVTDWSAGAERILGWTVSEIRGAPMQRLFRQEDMDQDRLRHEMREALARGRLIGERWQVRRDGSQFWARGELTPIRDGDGIHTGFLAVLRDRTEARRREQRFTMLAQTAAGLLGASDPDQVLGPLLDQSRTLLGFDDSFSYVLAPDGAHLRLMHAVGAAQDVCAMLAHASFDLPLSGIVAQTRKPLVINDLQSTTSPRYEICRRCGYDAFAGFPVIAGDQLFGVLSFAARSRSSFDDEALVFFETLARYVAIVRERLQSETALRQLTETLEQRVRERTAELQVVEAALRQSQKMEAVGQLAGGLAHDFNNLLTGITGSLELMERRVAQGRVGELDRYVTAAQGAARRAAALTHRLLAFSRRQTLAPRPTDAGRLIAGMEDRIRASLGPAISMSAPDQADGVWTMLVDPAQLEGTLLNLCSNARDAMPDGGRLTIEAGNQALDEREARRIELPPGDYVALSVTDTGTGMTPEVIAQAFDPFFTTKPIGMGTGLGLSMIYGFARQSNGQVRIESMVGQGTTVRLYLPRDPTTADTARRLAAPEQRDPPGAPPARAGETVLLVDDEPTVRMLVAEVLDDQAYVVLQAADGAGGLALLESGARIDLLVTDVGMPGGMNGRQLADAARVARPGLKVALQ